MLKLFKNLLRCQSRRHCDRDRLLWIKYRCQFQFHFGHATVQIASMQSENEIELPNNLLEPNKKKIWQQNSAAFKQ